MGPGQGYDLIKENEDLRDEARRLPAATATPWSKLVLYTLLAFGAGLGAAFGVVLATAAVKPTPSNAASSVATSTAGLSADVTLPTASSVAEDMAHRLSVLDHEEAKAANNETDGLEGVILDCGGNPDDARARGCVYDVMMQDWVPEPCYDPILTERYLAQGNWTWYADPDGNKMTDEDMRKGNHKEAWMSASYHQAHCVFSWEKLIRALRNNWPISQELLSYDHVLHCHHQTLGGEDMHKKIERDDGGIGVRAPTNYAKCALYRTWKSDFIPDQHSSIDK